MGIMEDFYYHRLHRQLKIFNFDRSMVTTPNVHAREDLHDPIKSLVARYRGEVEAGKRNILTADLVSQDLNGLLQLIRSCCYRAAINLTTRLLSSYGQGPSSSGTITRHSPVSLKVLLVWAPELRL